MRGADCHAAAGDFDKAVQVQSLAVARQEAFSDGPGTLENMRARLENYGKKQVYLEKPGSE